MLAPGSGLVNRSDPSAGGQSDWSGSWSVAASSEDRSSSWVGVEPSSRSRIARQIVSWGRSRAAMANIATVVKASSPCHLERRRWPFGPNPPGDDLMRHSRTRLQCVAPLVILAAIGVAACTSPAGATAVADANSGGQRNDGGQPEPGRERDDGSQPRSQRDDGGQPDSRRQRDDGGQPKPSG